MAALPRSSVSFRRQGSSGLVWEDKFLSGDLNAQKKREEGEEYREMRTCRSVGSAGMMERSRSGGARAWRTGKVSPAIDPPSPKVSVCGFCRLFTKSAATKRPKARKR